MEGVMRKINFKNDSQSCRYSQGSELNCIRGF